MKKENKLFIIIIFTAFLMLLEVFGGIWSGSMALLSDAGHMLTDALALVLSLAAVHISKKQPTPQKTFGYHRSEIIAALINGLILLGVSVFLFFEAVKRFLHPQPIQVNILLTIAVIGLLGNILGIFLIHKEGGENLNIRGAFLHLLSDAFSSVGVIVGGLIILFTRWNFIDSLIGILIAGLVLRSAISLIIESGNILLEGVPEDIDIDVLKKEVEATRGVKEFHEIHVWSITSGKRALSAHVLIDNILINESQKILSETRKLLAERFNIEHTTIETECDACENNPCL